ncbi:MAG: hypothetical protein ACOY41_06740 [Pseudomonadota bacterium]
MAAHNVNQLQNFLPGRRPGKEVPVRIFYASLLAALLFFPFALAEERRAGMMKKEALGERADAMKKQQPAR